MMIGQFRLRSLAALTRNYRQMRPLSKLVRYPEPSYLERERSEGLDVEVLPTELMKLTITDSASNVSGGIQTNYIILLKTTAIRKNIKQRRKYSISLTSGD